MNLLENMQAYIESAEARIKTRKENEAMAEKLRQEAERGPHNRFDSCKAILLSLANNGVINSERAEELLNFYGKALKMGANFVNYREYIAEALADVKDFYICEKGDVITKFLGDPVKVRVYDGEFLYIPDMTKRLPAGVKRAKQNCVDMKKQRDDFEAANAGDYELYQQLEKRFIYYPQRLRSYYTKAENAEVFYDLISDFAKKMQDK